jgi:hypothetical protein
MKNRKQKTERKSRKQTPSRRSALAPREGGKAEIPSGLEAHPGWKLKLQPFLLSTFCFLLFPR